MTVCVIYMDGKEEVFEKCLFRSDSAAGCFRFLDEEGKETTIPHVVVRKAIYTRLKRSAA